jgi:hypothetical protein
MFGDLLGSSRKGAKASRGSQATYSHVQWRPQRGLVPGSGCFWFPFARTRGQPMQPLLECDRRPIPGSDGQLQVCFLCNPGRVSGLALAPGLNEGNAQDGRIASRLAGTRRQKSGMDKFQGAMARQRTGTGLFCAWQRIGALDGNIGLRVVNGPGLGDFAPRCVHWPNLTMTSIDFDGPALPGAGVGRGFPSAAADSYTVHCT